MPKSILNWSYLSQVTCDNIEVRAFRKDSENIWVYGLWMYNTGEPIVQYWCKTGKEAYINFRELVARHSPK